MEGRSPNPNTASNRPLAIPIKGRPAQPTGYPSNWTSDGNWDNLGEKLPRRCGSGPFNSAMPFTLSAVFVWHQGSQSKTRLLPFVCFSLAQGRRTLRSHSCEKQSLNTGEKILTFRLTRAPSTFNKNLGANPNPGLTLLMQSAVITSPGFMSLTK